MVKLTRREVLALAAAGAAAVATEGLGESEGGTEVSGNGDIPRRELGKTGEKISILAFGGFHLIEVLPLAAEQLLDYYLDEGGNFIETARGYGDSEDKIGPVMKRRRDECFLSTKVVERTAKETEASINTCLAKLQTDHVDNLFMHNVSSQEELDGIMAPGGALAAAEKARDQGKVRFISVTSHSPETLLKALQSYPFDATMEWANYYDYFNFPLIFDQIIPYCRKNGIGLIAMKPVADGLLYRNPESAFRWVWSLPVASIAAGNNSMELLKKNIDLARSFKPMSEEGKQELYRNAPEYANYVCRRCETCLQNSYGLDPKAIFELEGYYDRQMYTGNVPNAAEYALRERLRFWYGQSDVARTRYASYEPKVPKKLDAGAFEGTCPYGIHVPRKLRIAAWKLTGDEEYVRGL